MPSRAYSLATLICGLWLSAPVQAQVQAIDESTSRANALFAAAKKQQAAGDLSAACASFADSYRLAPRGGTLINLAICHREIGELVLARRELLEARAVAQREGRSEREEIAVNQLRAVELRLSWLELAPAAELGTSSARLFIDDKPLTHEESATSIALMPGDHRVRVEAEGFETLELQLVLVSGARARVPTAPLQPRIMPNPPAFEPAASPGAVEQVITPVSPLPAAARDDYRAWRTSALVLGIVGIAAGLSAGAWAWERKSVVHAHCDPLRRSCDQQGLDANQLGSALSVVSTVACGVGLAGLGAWLVLPGGLLNERALAAGGSAGITWRGTF